MLERTGGGFLAPRGEDQRQKAPRKRPTTTGANWGGGFILGFPPPPRLPWGGGTNTCSPDAGKRAARPWHPACSDVFFHQVMKAQFHNLPTWGMESGRVRTQKVRSRQRSADPGRGGRAGRWNSSGRKGRQMELIWGWGLPAPRLPPCLPWTPLPTAPETAGPSRPSSRWDFSVWGGGPGVSRRTASGVFARQEEGQGRAGDGR